MGFHTQIRLAQMSGSLVDAAGGVGPNTAGVSLYDDTSVDAGAMLKHFARALAAIHGDDAVFDATKGKIQAGSGQYDLVLHQTEAGQKIHLDSDGSGTDALDIDSAGGIDVDADGAVDILAGDDSKFLTANTKGLVLGKGDQGTDTRLSIVHDSATTANEKVLLHNEAGDSDDALAITAAAGGIDITAATGKDMDLAAGQINLSSLDNVANAITISSNVGADETIIVRNFQGTGANAVSLEASAGSVFLSGSGGVTLHSSGQLVGSATAVSLTGEGNSEMRTQSGVLLHQGAFGLILSGGASDDDLAGNLQLSGAVDFSAGPVGSAAAMGSGVDGKMRFAHAQEFVDFKAKSVFPADGNITVIGAFNALAGAVSANESTILTASVTSTITKGNNVTPALQDGDSVDFSNARPRDMDVFVNGQLVVSGKTSDLTLGGIDYSVTGASTLAFAFDLVKDDVVVVVEKTIPA